MKFTVTVKVDLQALREEHPGLDADERRAAVRDDMDDAISGALGYVTEVVVIEHVPTKKAKPATEVSDGPVQP